MTGRRLTLSWTERLRKSVHQDTYSLLDAATLATTSQLDFSNPDAAPDFTAVSFYKIFGFPDLGALIVRKKSGGILSWRKYFGGGTVNMLTVLNDSSVMRKDESIHDGLEDGTLPFHNIIALGCAMKIHKKLYGSMDSISSHTSFLSRRLYDGMVQLTHGNGRPLCTIYNESTSRSSYRNPKTQVRDFKLQIMMLHFSSRPHSKANFPFCRNRERPLLLTLQMPTVMPLGTLP
jgi:molybdenum cofactor sulfurtransferase